MRLKLMLTLVFLSAFLMGKAQNTVAQNIEKDKSNELAIDFTKPDVNGKMIALSQLRGKYVLLDFWGSWCGACRMGMPHIKSLYTKYAKMGFEILGISNEKSNDLEEGKKLWLNAFKEDGLPWLNVINNETEMKQNVPKLYEVRGYPTYILLDKEGNIIGRWLGAGGEELDKQLAKIFNKG